jgi:glycogen synthase
MRIMFVSNLCPPYYLGGYEIACLTVAQALLARGHDILLLTTPSHVPGPPDAPFVRRYLSQSIYDFYGVPQEIASYLAHEAACSNFSNTNILIQSIRDFSPDVVYCWNLYGLGCIAILDALNIIGVPWVWHLMDNTPGIVWNSVPTHVRQVFKVISVSLHLLNEIADDTGMEFHREANLIPCWVDETISAARQPYRRDGATRFIYAGGIYPHKGVDLILEAAATLKASDLTSFTVDIFGEGQVAEYFFLADRLGVLDVVQFRGGRAQSELLQLYGDYDVFLFPTMEREPFGFVPIEAAAAGCVPIITRNCGAAERLVDNVHCIKIERRSEDLARAMSCVVRGEMDIARIGKAGAALVRSDLSLTGCMNQIESVLIGASKAWDAGMLSDHKLVLLTYVKHHLARSLVLGTE